MSVATINIKKAKSSDFKTKIIDYSGIPRMVIRENFPFFIHLKEFNVFDGPILMSSSLDMKLFKKYLDQNLIYIFESYDTSILYEELGLEKIEEESEPKNEIAC